MSKLTTFQLHLDKLLVILIKWRVMEHFMNEETKNSDNAKQVTEAVKVIEKDIFSRYPFLKADYEDDIKRVIVLLT